MASSTVVRIIRGAATQSRFQTIRKQEIDCYVLKFVISWCNAETHDGG